MGDRESQGNNKFLYRYCHNLCSLKIDFAYLKNLLKVFDLENFILRDVKNVKSYIILF